MPNRKWRRHSWRFGTRCLVGLAIAGSLALASRAPLSAQSGASTSGEAGRAVAARALRPGDGLKVRIFLEPDLSGEFVVDERGIVVLPKLGEWPLAGVPADSVRPRLLAAYKRYLTTDAIEILPFRRVTVTGSVLKPGLYPIDPSMTVGDAIVLAGGIAPLAKRNAIELRVAGSKSGVRVSGEQRLWESGAGGVLQVYVPQKSWLSQNARTVITVSLAVITTAATILTTYIVFLRASDN